MTAAAGGIDTATTADAAPDGVAKPLAGMRKVAARRMVEAWAAPVFHLGVDVDMTRVLSADLKSLGGTVTDAILQACATALVATPALNAHFADNVITTFQRVNIGLAVATEKGLTVPVLTDLQGADLATIAGKRKDVVTRARAGKLGMADVSGGTFTVSNLGMLGIDRFDAILNPPQIAILAVGSTVPTPVVRDGEVAVRPLAAFTLTCDHRAVDGASGAALLSAIRRAMEDGDPSADSPA
ncbi:2-oxo acid dehydrogenase subunit E2 [Nakamurella flavida]|uniref:2-oxo acid dehydrogenase subunit E2 n=1 Tax=Nakamurella flavida TaxID=363630 RepID=A0A938YHB7_9ACTN|nr:2-oxo acid dehydrogenase subunit E2 [Nakamurella flavida]MBM9475089.1 2-oxo acid dehydrogenase subunit E2 [Nakamurella flavida]MDP9776659.1 pyruvate dehydrogenase E2 component (dihydrolipoamide acetyltransferase) [Nakamurella flavida]